MKNRMEEKQESEYRPIFVVTLDDLTAALLMEVADMAHTSPSNIISSIVHDVLMDDMFAHSESVTLH